MHPTGLASCLLVWLLGIALVGVAPALAQQAGAPLDRPTCNSHDDLAAILEGAYAEQPNAFGLQGNGHLLEVFVSKETGSWTIVSTQPDGTSCIIAAGRYWQQQPRTGAEPVV